jgi:DNA mismatch repair protein MutH
VVATGYTSVAELLQCAEGLAGLSLGELASAHGVSVPPDLRRAKGFTGQLMERALAATAGSRAEPDFRELGVELKTLPVDRNGKPCESTFVCTINLATIADVEWQDSVVRKKLGCVLWMPVEGDRNLAVGSRRIGAPLLWRPDERQEAALRSDWDELASRISVGDVEAITGHLGRFLQVRPKAAHSRARRRAFDSDGTAFSTLPRGFYLRPSFTAEILRQNYVLPASGHRPV